MDMTNDGEDLTWQPLIMKCSRGTDKPKCMPFDVCADPECKTCKPRNDGAPMDAPKVGAPREEAMKKLESYPKMKATTLLKQKPDEYKGGMESYRNKASCSAMKSVADCSDREDCKTKVSNGKLKNCRPISCKKVRSHHGCVASFKKCTSIFKHGKFHRCKLTREQKRG